MISYKPLFKLLIDRDIGLMELRSKTGGSSATYSRFKKGEYVSLELLEKICAVLDVQFSDLVEYVPDKEGKQE